MPDCFDQTAWSHRNELDKRSDCTKDTSELPSEGEMKPKPLDSLNHFTVPVAILNTFKNKK
jgi:hypothetical protein